jgi:hypothetical protein
MAEPDPIDALLSALREDVSNTLTMINIVVALRRNSGHLLQLLSTMLHELQADIEAALPAIPSEEEEDDGTSQA